MHRPLLNHTLDAAEFERWYWLKAELLAFCREAGLPRGGSKPELASRIAAYLGGRPFDAPTRTSRTGPMPLEFTLETLIGDGWQCTPSLGAFMRSHCGASFRFNASVRHFVHTQAGHTLAEAVACYRASVSRGAPKTAIPAQLEYNRHTREFHAKNPGATRQQVLEAWWAKRSRPAA
jgi:hypothetical protein